MLNHLLVIAGLLLPQEVPVRVLAMYDVSDLVAAEETPEPGDWGLTPTAEQLVAVLRSECVTAAGSEVQLKRGVLVVNAPQAEHEVVTGFLDRLRSADAESYGVFVLLGRVEKGRYGRLPDGYAGPADVARVCRLEGVAGDHFSVQTEPGKDLRPVLAALPGEDETIDLQAATLHSLSIRGEPSRPLRRLTLSEAKTVRFVEGWDVFENVEGYPDGLAAPRLKEYEEGLQLEGLFVPLPAATAGDSRIRFFLTLRTGRVARPVPAEETEHGTVHRPTLDSGRIEVSVTFNLGKGFAVVVPDGAEDGLELLVAIYVNETP